jgi:hypothetical protein
MCLNGAVCVSAGNQRVMIHFNPAPDGIHIINIGQARRTMAVIDYSNPDQNAAVENRQYQTIRPSYQHTANKIFDGCRFDDNMQL